MGPAIRVVGLFLVFSISVANGDLASVLQNLFRLSSGSSKPLANQQDRGESRGASYNDAPSSFQGLVNQLYSKSRYNDDDDYHRQEKQKQYRNNQRLQNQFRSLVNLLGSQNHDHDHESRIHSVIHEDISLVPTNRHDRYRSAENDREDHYRHKQQGSRNRSNKNREKRIYKLISDLLSRKDRHDDRYDQYDRHDQRDDDHYERLVHDKYGLYDHRHRHGASDSNRVQQHQIGRANEQPQKEQQSPIVKTLLRIATSVRCGAQNQCKNECEEEPKCEDKCEEKFECDEPDPCGKGSCDEDDNPSTRGIPYEPEPDTGCKRCKK